MAIVPVIGRPRPDVQMPRVNIVAVAILVVCFVAGIVVAAKSDNPLYIVAGAVLGLVLMLSPKVANQWEKGVILRLGRLRLRGPRGAQDEFTLAAIAQNLRRLAKLTAHPPPIAAMCVA